MTPRTTSPAAADRITSHTPCVGVRFDPAAELAFVFSGSRFMGYAYSDAPLSGLRIRRSTSRNAEAAPQSESRTWALVPASVASI